MTKNEDIYRVTHTTFDREMTPRYVKENRRKKMEVNNPENRHSDLNPGLVPRPERA